MKLSAHKPDAESSGTWQTKWEGFLEQIQISRRLNIDTSDITCNSCQNNQIEPADLHIEPPLLLVFLFIFNADLA